jgi:membrane protein
MQFINKFIDKADRFQEGHRLFAFSLAVIKKYNEDSAGRQAALLTYYSFLSLFPLLLILTTITDVVVGKNPHLHNTIISGLTSYFPLLGNQLAAHVNRINASGLAVAVGVLFTLYGTRGVANVFRHGMQDIWDVPKKERDGFPKSLLKSIALVVIGGIGFILASIIAGYAGSSGHHGLPIRLLAIVINMALLFMLFNFLINFSLPKHITIKDIWVGAVVSAIVLVILQSAGGFILARELKRLDALYSYFAVSLGLLFWIYLQAQVIYYSAEIAVVKSKNLWPRSLKNNTPTLTDKSVTDLG